MPPSHRRRCRKSRCRRLHRRSYRRAGGSSGEMSQSTAPPPSWRAFERRWAGLFRIIRREYPGFWEDLGEELRERYERSTTTRGAVVREWPAGRDAATQATPLQRDVATQEQPRQRHANIQIRPRRHDVAVDTADLAGGTGNPVAGPAGTEPEPPNKPEETAGRAALEETLEREARRARSRERRERCWNCGATSHFATVCPEPRRAFCYRCGRPGHTVKTPPTCGEEWRGQGPYRPGCGHPGPKPPADEEDAQGTPLISCRTDSPLVFFWYFSIFIFFYFFVTTLSYRCERLFFFLIFFCCCCRRKTSTTTGHRGAPTPNVLFFFFSTVCIHFLCHSLVVVKNNTG